MSKEQKVTKLGKDEKRYATLRLACIFSKKQSEIIEKYPEPRFPTESEQLDMIKDGRAKLRSDKHNLNMYTNLSNAFDFSKFSERIQDHQINVIQPKVEKLEKEKTAIEDKIHFGDCSTIAVLLEKFSNLKV